jgi:hypothetical protein
MRSGIAVVLAALLLAACSTSGCLPQEQDYAEPPEDSYTQRPATLTVDGSEHAVELAEVDARFFPATRALPLLGRLFQDMEFESDARRTAILTHPLWQESFAESPTVIGTDIDIDGHAFTVVGVMPRGFDSPPDADIWITRVEQLRLAPNR